VTWNRCRSSATHAAYALASAVDRDEEIINATSATSAGLREAFRLLSGTYQS
jgi:hypothetical protein